MIEDLLLGPSSVLLLQHPPKRLILLCMRETDLGKVGVVQCIVQISNLQMPYVGGDPNATEHPFSEHG